MLFSKKAKTFFLIVSFLLFTGDVKGEEEKESYPSYNETDNTIMVLEFPYDIDRNNTNTFASTTFSVEEDMADLTICFSFMVNTLKSAWFDQ